MKRKANNKSRVVMAFGTFDLVHPGHVHFLKQAKKLGDFLVVSIARDVNVKKIKKHKPWLSEKNRAAAVRALGIADKVVLGDIKKYTNHISKIKPEIIALGHDQKAYTGHLRQDLKAVGLNPKIVRLKAFKREFYRSSKIKQRLMR